MAKTLSEPTIAIDLRGVIDSAVQSVRSIQKKKSNELEILFQQQIADGLSYDGQVEFLQSQLNEENSSSFRSDDIVNDLTSRITQTKKLARFARYRDTYARTLADLKAGRESSKEALSTLKSYLDSAGDDEDLLNEIQGNIVSMEGEVKQMEDTMIQNQLKKAQYDGTQAVLNDAISMVKDRRSKAQLSGLDDDASAYDVWVTTLTKQLNETKIVDSLHQIDVQVNTKGLNSSGKLTQLNQLIRASDGNTPITIDGVSYGSAKEYWTDQRDNYLAGTGTGIFGDFFKELGGEYTQSINAAVARDGLVTTATLDKINTDFADLSGRAEFQPFLTRLDNYKSLTLGSAIQTTAQSIIDRADYTFDFGGATAALQSYAQKYGVNVDTYLLALAQDSDKIASQLANDPNSPYYQNPDAARAAIGTKDILKPEDAAFKTPDAATPDATAVDAATTPSAFSGAAGYTGNSIVDFLSQAGHDSSFAARQKLAADHGITGYTGSSQQNTALLNLLKNEATKSTVTPPAETTTPAKTTQTSTVKAPTTTKTTTTPSTTSTPAKTTTTTPAATSTPTATTVKAQPSVTSTAPATPKSTYTGSSIVDYLSSTGQASDFNSRSAMAKQAGIVNYTGTADQNTTLLKKLRGF